MASGIVLEAETKRAERAMRKLGRVFQARPLLNAIGNRHLRWINQNFRVGGLERRWPPLSPNTIAARRQGRGGGSARPLQDTGRLRQSYNVAVKPGEVEVGTNVEYAAVHEKGTGPSVIRPKRAKALRFFTSEGPRFATAVRHPGIPQRKMLPTKAVALKLAVDTVEAVVAKSAREAGF